MSYQGNEKREYQMIVVAISRGRYRILGRFLRNWAIFTVSFDEFDPNDFTPIEFPATRLSWYQPAMLSYKRVTRVMLSSRFCCIAWQCNVKEHRNGIRFVFVVLLTQKNDCAIEIQVKKSFYWWKLVTVTWPFVLRCLAENSECLV